MDELYVVDTLLLDKIWARKNESKPLRFYGKLDIGNPCNWVLVPLEKIKEKE